MNTRNQGPIPLGWDVNWFGKLRGNRIGIMFNPKHRVERVDLTIKKRKWLVYEPHRTDQRIEIQNIAMLIQLLDWRRSPVPEDDLETFVSTFAYLSGFLGAVRKCDVDDDPEYGSFVHRRFGPEVECTSPEMIREKICFYATDNMFIDDFHHQLFRIELNLELLSVCVRQVASTLATPSPNPHSMESG
jgi:hypothetical protein